MSMKVTLLPLADSHFQLGYFEPGYALESQKVNFRKPPLNHKNHSSNWTVRDNPSHKWVRRPFQSFTWLGDNFNTGF